MKKQWLLNLFLLCLVGVLAALVYFSDSPQPSAQLNTLTRLPAETVKSIVIEHNGHSTRLQKHDGRWRLIEPLQIAANEFRVNTLLQLLRAPVHRQYNISALDTEKTGLDTKQAQPTRVVFDGHEILFGIVNPVTGLRYVRMGNTAYAIEDVYSPLLRSHFGTLVSLDLLPPDSRMEKLELLDQTLHRDSQGRWHASNGLDADRIMTVLDDWRHAQAFGIHAYMPRQELGTVTIHLQGGEVIRFVITDTDPWLILARPELQLEYHLDIEAYDRLIHPQ